MRKYSMQPSALLIHIACIICAGCIAKLDETSYPGFVRQHENVYLMENHCHSLVAWHMSHCTNATLIHIDTHDDCRPISIEKQRQIAQLLGKTAYSELFSKSDTGRFLDLKVSDADMLYDLGNFIYPSLTMGLVSNVYWIVPQPRITAKQRERLKGVMQRSLPGSTAVGTTSRAGGFELSWSNRMIRVITLEELPTMPRGCLLDLDIDFFAFPQAMTEEHLVARINRNPEDVFRYLKEKVPDPQVITISSSVWGGYLPLLDRFLADAAYDFFLEHTFPVDATHLLTSLESIRKGTPSPPTEATDDVYTPAVLHFQALTALSTGDIASCKSKLLKAARLSPVYRKGLLDAAEALLSMNRAVAAKDFIETFESLNGGASYNSLAIRAMVAIDAGDTDLAMRESGRLIEWDSNPYTLLIHGAAVKAHGDLQKADSIFRRVLSLSPANSAAHFNIGTIREATGDLPSAIAEYRQAIELRPSLWQAHDNLGHLMLRQNQLLMAESHLRKALTLNPLHITSINNLGLALARQRRYKEAIEMFRNGLKLNPQNITLRLNLAEALLLTGKTEHAREMCEIILKQGENDKAVEMLRTITDAEER